MPYGKRRPSFENSCKQASEIEIKSFLSFSSFILFFFFFGSKTLTFLNNRCLLVCTRVILCDHLWPCKACTTLIFVSKNLFKQLDKHCSSGFVNVFDEIGTLSLHFLKHMSVKLWIDICTLDFEFSSSMNCKISFLEASSRFCNAACEI